MNHTEKPSDICAHLGDEYDRYLGAIVPPLFQNSLFTCKRQNHGYAYSRVANPTIEILEEKLAALEHAQAARVFSSGMGRKPFRSVASANTTLRPAMILVST